MLSSRNPPPWLLEPIRLVESLVDSIGIVVVANVQGRTRPADDYEEDSIITEFLVNEELDHIVGGFQKAGVYCETVLDEEGFLSWLESRRARFPRPHPVIYNLAQNGTGSARLSLVPALCRLHNLPLLDSGAYAVTLARHKFHVSTLLRGLGLPTARSWWFTPEGWLPERPPAGMRMIAKPTYESASIGIHRDSVFLMSVEAEALLKRRAAMYRQPLIVQEFVPGFEVEVPVFEADSPRATVAVGISLGKTRNLGDTFLTYDDVAVDGYAFYDFSEENAAAASEAMRAAERAFSCLGFNSIARVDFRIRIDGTVAIIEVACKPHLTSHSSFAFVLKQLGLPPTDLFKFLVGSAAQRHSLDSVGGPKLNVAQEKSAAVKTPLGSELR